MNPSRGKASVRLLAAFLAAVQTLVSASDALAQVREVLVAPVGTPGVVGVTGVNAMPATLGCPSLAPTTALTQAATLKMLAITPVIAQRAALKTAPISGGLRAQSLASADAPNKSTLGTVPKFDLFRGEARTPLAKLVLAPSISTSRAFFDQAKPAAEPEAPGVGNVEELSVFIVREGRPAVRTTVGEIGALLKADAALASDLNAHGKVRVVLDVKAPAGALQPADVSRAEAALRARGVQAPLQVEKLAIDRERPAAPTESKPSASVERKSGSLLTWPFREAAFLWRSMKAAYTKPQFWEVLGGLGTEGVSFAMTATTFAATITWQHPWLLGASLAMLLAQNAFHGFWLNTWTNFQDNLNKFRGPTYQTVFNWTYFQASGAVYRTFAWAAHPATTVAAWTLEYWKAIGLMSIVGTFCGVLGYNGLNTLYDKGRLNRFQRSAIQQGRNLLFLVSGPLFGAGVLWLFWPLFWTLQALDLVLFTLSLAAKPRPVLYVADGGTAAASEFATKYPATAATETVSAWAQAKAALKAQPPVMLLLLLYKGARYLWGKLRAASSSTSGPSGGPPPKT
ncbi:MAG: hypothetical protein HY925_15385 [Elusimicrobia bacterium]|nr:hypothetical protein [Elusimicrobiota bacterium]